MIDFTNLKNEEMAVSEYAPKIIQLSHSAPYRVTTKGKKAQIFQLGLRPSILSQMSLCADMVHCMNEALEHERWVVKGKRIREDSTATNNDHRPSKRTSNPPFQAQQDKPSGQKNPQSGKINIAWSSAPNKE